ncbi:MAG: HAD family hydrolase [Bacteroidetes bacterium]|nr:HAD family hydrolase [Bacteroidota bacterium]
MQKAIFIDKDGTLIKDVPYNVDPDLVELVPGCERLRSLQDIGYKLIVVSNQPGLALGYFTEAQLMKAVNRMFQLLAEKEVYPLAFYFCPHAATGTIRPYNHACGCRKPLPGIILRAAEDLGIDPSSSWMIGDIFDDVEAGNRAGCQTILIDNGNETEWRIDQFREPHYVRTNLSEAARMILQKNTYHDLHL